ncbi:MAG: putative Ig domain-containing protein [Planctomycetes bacterium]|nr:putative Ig domain-containing protein [Planctomycetota bacterium]
MQTKFFCISCGKKFVTDVKFAGKPFECSICGTMNTVPESNAIISNVAGQENAENAEKRNIDRLSEKNIQEINISKIVGSSDKEQAENGQQPKTSAILSNRVSLIRQRLEKAEQKTNHLQKKLQILIPVSLAVAFIVTMLIFTFDSTQSANSNVKGKVASAKHEWNLPEVHKVDTSSKKNKEKPVNITPKIPQPVLIEETTESEKMIIAPLSIISSLPESFMVGYREQIELQATGGVAPYNWLLSEGNLPFGMKFVRNKIVGTPEDGTVGTYVFTLKCIDSKGNTAEMPVISGVDEMLMFEFEGFPAFMYVEDQVEYIFSATGGTMPYSFELVESLLPEGLQYDADAHAFRGSPRIEGEFTITLRVTDSQGRTNDNALETFDFSVMMREKSDVVRKDKIRPEPEKSDDDDDGDDDEPEIPALTEVQQLMRKGAELHNNEDYQAAIEIYLQVLKLDRDNVYALYNIACAYALLNDKIKAFEYLVKAVKAGFIDFSHIKNDNDLKILRNSTKFKKLIKDLEKRFDITGKALNKPLEELFPGYLIHRDEANRLIFLTNVGSNDEKRKKILEFISAQLMNYAKAQRESLFDKQPSSYIKILLPNNRDFSVYRKQAGYSEIVGGWYNPGTKLLISKSLGHTLIHEFTHALHYADTWSRGIWHKIWFSEGVATCFENSMLPEGSRKNLTPIHNWRMDLAIKAVQSDSKYYVPWDELFNMSRTKFLNTQNIQYHYAQARYIVYWLNELGKLKEFYDAYNQTYKKDKSGIKAFEKVFGNNLSKIEVQWKTWMKSISRPTRSAWLGITASYRTNPQGLKLLRIFSNSPAKSAKLRKGDILLRVGNIPVDMVNNFAYAMTVFKPADEIEIAFIRRDEIHLVKVILTSRENQKGY